MFKNISWPGREGKNSLNLFNDRLNLSENDYN